jgi:hypothetical protein
MCGMRKPRSQSDVARLLYDLCVNVGFCLPPDAQERLESMRGVSADAFTDAVISEEGLDPQLIEKWMRLLVREYVVRHLGE